MHKEVLEIVKKHNKKTVIRNLRNVRIWASAGKLERETSKRVNFYCESIVYNILLNYKLK